LATVETANTKSTRRTGKASAPIDGLTPAMRQFVEQKKRVGEAILLFRMGDFYETFYDDALLCSKVLGIALTARNKNSDNPIPLAGIPYHALETYLRKLVVAGHKVAISEQLEDPKEAKGVVKRDVVRIVTAGTLTDEALLSAKDDNILAAVCIRKNEVGLALVELAGGRFEVVDVSRDSLLDELVRARPAELLIDDERDYETERIAEQLHQICGNTITRRPPHEFSNHQAERSLLEHFDVSTLAGFGFERVSAALCAAGCVIQYLQETQKTALDHIAAIRRRVAGDFLQIDHSTWRSLEIERTLRSGQIEGTLLWAVDRTLHPIGGRKLRHWLRTPLTDATGILHRQDAVRFLVDNDANRIEIRRLLKTMADVERIAGRVALARTYPRDLAALGQTLGGLPKIAEQLKESRIPFLTEIASALEGLGDLAELLRRAIREDPSNALREGGFIAGGFDAELDRLRSVGADGQTWLAEFQKRQIEQTGIAFLKVGFNRVFGYYIEVPNSGKDKVPIDYVRKQTIKSAERYITEELKNYETDVLTARDRANELEYKLFEQLRDDVATRIQDLLRVADAMGRADVVAGFAELAIERRYVRPDFVDDAVLTITDGRHPVLDQALGDDFVPNDTAMNEKDALVFVITGPNMAGKSTYIRQVALLQLLAQTGSFVPVSEMTCSVVDRIFARVGSSDEIMRGQSTFMVEMTEAANILHYATARSLVVLDELGRGTSTFDGLSLAWAITEHLATTTRCRSLVATHYHEMTELSELLRGVRNYNVAVRETGDRNRREPGGQGSNELAGSTQDEGIVFLHRIVEGGASKSYGIHVARLAGIPKSVIARSREVLDELQRSFAREARGPQLAGKKNKDDPQLSLFRDPGEELLEALRDLDPERIAPMDALQQLIKWKKEFS
jgi:DNA mismatch repair protein MutS